MILRAVSKRGKDVPEYVRHPVIGPAEALEYALIPGNSYVAYGFTVWQDHIWFYVCDEDYPSVWYPIMHPAALFHDVDPRLSKYWVFGHHPEAPNGRHLFIVSFPEWAGDQGFYERLVDRSETALRIFQEYKGLMDEEASTTHGSASHTHAGCNPGGHRVKRGLVIGLIGMALAVGAGAGFAFGLASSRISAVTPGAGTSPWTGARRNGAP